MYSEGDQMESSTDDDLAKRSLHEVDAFATLYRRHLHRVYSYLISRVGNIQDAQDLTAQTFLAALKGIGTYEPRDMFGAWLLGIAKRKTSDHFRSSKPLVLIDDVEMTVMPEQSVDDQIIERLEIETVVCLLEKINPDRAEALRLHYFGVLKLRQVAELMGKSEGAVKMLVARALDDIRTLLAVKEKTL
jgi:RNA polymerase sigma-70 factor (ECF subfamily)